MSADKQVALSNFYKEEFLRHIEHLQASGILDEDEACEAVTRARQAVLSRLDDVCGLASFPALAETLLQNFDTLSRLRRLDPKSRRRN